MKIDIQTSRPYTKNKKNVGEEHTSARKREEGGRRGGEEKGGATEGWTKTGRGGWGRPRVEGRRGWEKRGKKRGC